jgi:hypothetical protein
MTNERSQPYRLTSWLGNADLRAMSAANLTRDVLSYTLQDPNSTSPWPRQTQPQSRRRSALRSSALPLPWSSTASSISSASDIQKSPTPLSTMSGRPTTMRMATQYFRVCMNITLKFLQPLTHSLTRKSYQSAFARPSSMARPSPHGRLPHPLPRL